MGAVAGEGRTVLFVSHDMTNVSVLCDSVLLLEGGGVKMRGRPADVIGAYVQQGVDSRPAVTWPLDEAPGGPVARIVGVSAGGPEHAGADSFALQGPVPLTVDFVVLGNGV